jgi:hypothetical protein
MRKRRKGIFRMFMFVASMTLGMFLLIFLAAIVRLKVLERRLPSLEALRAAESTAAKKDAPPLPLNRPEIDPSALLQDWKALLTAKQPLYSEIVLKEMSKEELDFYNCNYVGYEPPFEIPDTAPFNETGTWADVNWDEPIAFVQTHAEACEAFRQLLRAGSPLAAINDITDLNATMECYESIRAIADYCRIAARVHVHVGNMDDALDDLDTIFLSAAAFDQQPLVIAQMAKSNCYGVAYDTVMHAFPAGSLSEVQIERILSWSAHSTHRRHLQSTLSGEMLFAHLYSHTPEGKELWEMEESAWILNIPGAIASTVYPFTPLPTIEVIGHLELYGKLLALTELPYYEAIQHPDYGNSEGPARFAYFFDVQVVTAQMAFLMQARFEAKDGLLQLGLRVERYHATEGHYPPALADLASHFPEGLPIDPFSGEAFRYTVSEDSFLLYSLGPNQRDDGGKPGRTGDGDMVWRGVREK